MKFVEYNPNTLEAVCFGEGSIEALQAWADTGHPVIMLAELPSDFALHRYNVNPETNTLELAPIARPDPNAPPPQLDPRLLINPISDRQFFQKAAIEGYITREDALAAVQTGFIPPPFQDFINTIADPDEKFNATMLFSGATEYYRQHHLTDLLGVTLGLNAEQLDTFWIDAAKL